MLWLQEEESFEEQEEARLAENRAKALNRKKSAMKAVVDQVLLKTGNGDMSLGDYLSILSSEERKAQLKKLISEELFGDFSNKVDLLLERRRSLDVAHFQAKVFGQEKLNGSAVLPGEVQTLVNGVQTDLNMISEALKVDS